LLRACGATKAFHDALQSAGLSDRLLTFCFSEFGRRVKENVSLGTDDGTAGRNEHPPKVDRELPNRSYRIGL
jgi:uncharacterized protein (DUF1501 family)